MLIKTILFKRTEQSPWESGVSFECNGTMNDRIIDKDGNLLTEPTVWNIRDKTVEFCIDLTPTLNYLNPPCVDIPSA